MNDPISRFTTVALSLFVIQRAAAIEISLPPIYADHMIFQTGRPIVLSGDVTNGRPTNLEVSLAGKRVPIETSLFGSWTVTLDPVEKPGGSHTLIFYEKGEPIHTLNDITFGDVWLCGGQSNMEWELATIGATDAIESAEFPHIRLMEVTKVTSTTPQEEVRRFDLAWSQSTPEAVRRFSAVGYFFGRELHEETGRPIGLIQSAWGGSRIETWIPDTALKTSPYAERVASRTFGEVQDRPSLCYNAMIHGLAPLAIKGVIWYQGEDNASHAGEYRSLHETLITSWREHWQTPELPFYFVQLANWRPGANWAELREAQWQTLAVPNTGMAVTIDIGDSNDIHPRNKLDVGKRLAAIALAKDYGQTDRVYSGPQFRSASTDGKAITLHFNHVGSGLATSDGAARVQGFEVKYESGNWRDANAMVSDDTVVLPGSLFTTTPKAVRYGWASDPEVNLKNKEGFPAVPFQFDGIDQTYTTWRDQLVGTARLPGEDANHDGMSNLLDYASAGKRLDVMRHEDSLIVAFDIRAGASDLTGVLESSEELNTWTEIWATDQPDGSGFSWSQEDDWGATLTNRYQIVIPHHGTPARQFRVRYHLAP